MTKSDEPNFQKKLLVAYAIKLQLLTVVVAAYATRAKFWIPCCFILPKFIQAVLSF